MIGLERGKVTLYDHDPEWNKEAARTIKTIKDILGDVAIQTEHVGSTSVNSIKAKPIIDIAVAVIHFSDIISYNRKLAEHGGSAFMRGRRLCENTNLRKFLP